jgi:hypothetical protein
MSKVKFTTRKRKIPWYRRDPKGSPEELEEAFKIMENYLYNILSYADKPEGISEEALEKERRIFTMCMEGPKKGHFRMSTRSKLLSPDVLYILTSSLPARHISEKFGISDRMVKDIRSGLAEEWYWEYMFVRRLKEIIRYNILSDRRTESGKIAYILYKTLDEENKEVLYITSSLRRAKGLRENLFNKKDLAKLLKKEELDILYPIEKVQML